jgi:release factor glutamine methyltransferase
MQVTVHLSAVQERLHGLSDTPTLDAQVLLAHILDKPRTWVLAHPESVLPIDAAQRLAAAVKRMESGEPLPYVLGQWEFYGLPFYVTHDTLIPRPETELLVERALSWLRSTGCTRVADVGTGSGCIAITLAVHRFDAELTAIDISSEALAVAQRNAERHGVSGRIRWLQSDLLPPKGQPFDLICANLPYIPSTLLNGLQVARYEPHLALDGGPDGLALIRGLLAGALYRLAPQGALLLEIEASQGEAARQLARERFPQARIRIVPDLAGHDRLLSIQT